ncbi:hypothetical protein [Symmachiella dynata]|uniref:hypothetical protein n=1 Tax=Symmachiella dynata TaxID=2527995 RepID=UPI0030ED70CD|tara:strand:+ start:467 stop:742 length:276 start_codon:yes stop_codon:yes gene_type:complete
MNEYTGFGQAFSIGSVIDGKVEVKLTIDGIKYSFRAPPQAFDTFNKFRTIAWRETGISPQFGHQSMGLARHRRDAWEEEVRCAVDNGKGAT